MWVSGPLWTHSPSFDLRHSEIKKILNKVNWEHPRIQIGHVLTQLKSPSDSSSTEQGPSWEATRSSAGQEIRRILWNPKVHYRIHKRPQPAPILSQINTDCASIKIPEDLSQYYPLIYTYFFQVIISITSLHQNPVYISPVPYTCHIPCPSHCNWYDLPNIIGWGVQGYS